MFVFVHAQGIKTVHARGGGVKKWQNSVHVVVECPLTLIVAFFLALFDVSMCHKSNFLPNLIEIGVLVQMATGNAKCRNVEQGEERIRWGIPRHYPLFFH